MSRAAPGRWAAAGIRLQACHGETLIPWLDALAQLRIRVFREFPYLYAGDLDYERSYLQTYIGSPRSLVVLAFDGAALVGATTAVPLQDEMPEVRTPLAEAGYPTERFFYCGESILLSAYRGLGLGHEFFDRREAHARDSDGFEWIGFCAVDRPTDHPRRPPEQRSLESFWQGRGYAEQPGLQARISWRDLDESAESAKSLTFWLRPL